MKSFDSSAPGISLAIETDRLSRDFGTTKAVDQIDLRVREGEIFGLLGPNGAGKSTTIKRLTTLLRPTAGSARVAGFDLVRQAHDGRRSIGYGPQLPSADGSRT